MSKKIILVLLAFFMLAMVSPALAQCSLCTKTAMQMGEKPALGLNEGILYLMLSPFVIVAVIGYRWWKNEKTQ